MHKEPTVVSLARLRRLLPTSPTNYAEALRIAERQANLLVTAWGGGSRAIRESDVEALEHIAVLPDDLHGIGSGSSRYYGSRWYIILDKHETPARQRFTLAHELKHVIDAGVDLASVYSRLSDRQVERVCDHFAACLLMSKRLVYRLWGDGLRTPEALAYAAGVSVQAMTIRLEQLGLPVNRAEAGRATCRHPVRSAMVPGLRGRQGVGAVL